MQEIAMRDPARIYLHSRGDFGQYKHSYFAI
jgi:hypothetical protein